MKQRCGIRRFVIRAGIFLLLVTGGAIVNIAVAWGLATLIDPLDADAEVITQRNPDLPLMQWFVMRVSKSGSVAVMASGVTQAAGQLSVNDPRVPEWSRLRQLPAYNEGEPMPMLYDIGFGWPFISLWYAMDIQRDPASGTFIGERDTDALGTLMLPRCVIWPGFTINTLIYATIIWFLIAAPFTLRRRRHLKRGLCPACAYPVGTSDLCTECGKPIPSPLRGRAREGVERTSSSTALNDTEGSTLPLPLPAREGSQRPASS